MKLLLQIALVFAATALFAATSTPKGFTDNLDEALVEASKSGKFVYACFTGSDWCGWCKRLDREVLTKQEFLDGIENDYILVYIDSPSNLNLLSERAKVENPKLVEQYRIEGFPIALILDGDGQVLAKTGYHAGGPQKYVEHLMEWRKNPAELKVKAAEERAKDEIFDKYIRTYHDRGRELFRELDGVVAKFIQDEMNKGVERSVARERSRKLLGAYSKHYADLADELEKAAVPPEAQELKNEQVLKFRNFAKILGEGS